MPEPTILLENFLPDRMIRRGIREEIIYIYVPKRTRENIYIYINKIETWKTSKDNKE